jgi:hypothetical protein
MSAGLNAPAQHIFPVISCVFDEMPVGSWGGLVSFASMGSNSARVALELPDVLLQALDLPLEARDVSGRTPPPAHATEATEADENMTPMRARPNSGRIHQYAADAVAVLPVELLDGEALAGQGS